MIPTFKATAVALLFTFIMGCGGGAAAPRGTAADQGAASGPGRAAEQISGSLAAAARPITGGAEDYREILSAAAGARRVLLGESTHGTHEYYRERGRITEMLVRDHGFNAVAVEGDWTPIRQLNDYVRGLGSDRSAEQAMGGLTGFPRWMWRNAEFRDFVERLRLLNMARPAAERVGLYGMDVYDLFGAADAAIAYLGGADRAAAKQAEAHYRCFRRHGRSAHAYGEATRSGRTCQRQAEAVLALIRKQPRPTEPEAAERHFAAVRSAASVAAAEAYFRTVYAGSLAWNVRDQRMAQNVEEIAEHLQSLSGRAGKVVMWSHNTHSGDARATFAADRGELNLGQLMRQRHGNDAFLLGFFSHGGTVLAASEWDQPGRVYDMRPALAGSYSALFRTIGLPAFSLLLRGKPDVQRHLKGPMLERAIGVVYQPHSERMSHYFEARLADQFDAAVYFNTTKAVTPLGR
ncbi:MAG TPA: erythromycin esterase family protein [Allosphingosinicella sp.]|jgi:erythromycin esterase-like protein